MNPFIFVFLDGFGLGDPTPSNPLFTSGITAFEEIAGNKLLKGIDVLKPEILFKGIDASLGPIALAASTFVAVPTPAPTSRSAALDDRANGARPRQVPARVSPA